MEFLKAMWKSFYGSFFLSIESTLVGIALGFGDWLFSYLGTIQLPTWAHVLVGIASLAFVAYKQDRAKKAVLVPAAPAPVEPPRGFARIGALAALSGVMLALTGATCQKPIVVDVLHCGENAIVKRVPDLTSQIVAILRAGDPGWQSVLLTLVDAAGEAGACAWEVVYAQIVGGLTLTDRPREAVPADVAARAQEFQALLQARAMSARAGR